MPSRTRAAHVTTATPHPTSAATIPTATTSSPRATMRTPALVGGAALLLLAVLSGWVNFGVVEALVTDGDAARTARDILAAETTFRLGVVALLVAAILDIVVAWALGVFFAPVDRGIATVAAWFRAIYAGIFMIAITELAGALGVLERAAPSTAFSRDQLQVEALQRIESFHLVWDVGLLLFGLHLALIGYLAYRSDYAPRFLGVLLVVAGAGYVVDGLGALLAPGSLPEVAVFTFVGEVLLIVWLLVRGRTVDVGDDYDRRSARPSKVQPRNRGSDSV